MKRLLFVCLVLAVAAGAQAQYPAGSCYSTSSGITCNSGSTFTLEAGATFAVAATPTFTLGLTITGGTVSLNDASNYALNLATGTSTGTITLGGTGTQTIAIGNGIGAKTVGLGSATGASATTIQGGTGDITITSADDIILSSTSAGGILSFNDTAGGVVNIGTDDTVKDTISIGSAKDDVGLVSGAGAEAASGNVCAERCVGAICQTVCTLTAVSVTITDPTGAAGYGGVKLYDFPAGYINRLGIVADIAATAGAGGISDTWDGDISFGSTAANATATLHDPTTEDDWVLTAGTTQAVGGVGACDTQSAVTEQTIADGHTTATDLYLNFEVDDADITAGDTLAVSGTVTITWVNLGDNG